MLMQSNVRGVLSKHVSLQAFLNENSPTVMTLQELNLPMNVKPRFEGYFSYVHKGQNKHMGGISTLVGIEAAPHSICVSDGGSQEYIVTRHS